MHRHYTTTWGLTYGTFILIEKTYRSPVINVTIRASRLADDNPQQWRIKVDITGTDQTQVVGASSQAERIMDRAVVMTPEELKEQTAFLFEEPGKGPIRGFIGRVVEGVISNLLASGVIAVGGFAAGVVVGRAAG